MNSLSVLDSSAVLALLGDEAGADNVKAALEQGAVISSVNLCEVVSKLADEGLSLDEIRGIVTDLGLGVRAFDGDQAYRAGIMRRETKNIGLSLGDRACICLGISLGLPVVTADRTWLKCSLPTEVHAIR